MPIAPSKTPTTTRFFQRGLSKAIFCPTMVDYKAPTFAELNAGTDLSDELADWNGWSTKTNFIDTPSLGTTFDGKIIGTSVADDSSLTLYVDRLGVDSRVILKEGVTGFMVFLDNGLTSTKGDIFPCAVGGTPKQRSLSAATTRRVDFAITRKPAEDVTIPTV
jgi:hypothetical protein